MTIEGLMAGFGFDDKHKILDLLQAENCNRSRIDESQAALTEVRNYPGLVNLLGSYKAKFYFDLDGEWFSIRREVGSNPMVGGMLLLLAAKGATFYFQNIEGKIEDTLTVDVVLEQLGATRYSHAFLDNIKSARFEDALDAMVTLLPKKVPAHAFVVFGGVFYILPVGVNYDEKPKYYSLLSSLLRKGCQFYIEEQVVGE